MTRGWTLPAIVLDDVDLSTMRLFLGIDPAADPSGPVSIFGSWTECPVVKPVKRRGLTGKRYRIARRRYAREMRAYDRGLIPPVQRAMYLPRAQHVATEEGIRGVSARFTILDEAVGEPWYDMSPRDAKPGYGE